MGIGVDTYVAVRTTPGMLEFNSKPAKLYMKTENPLVEIEFKPVKVEIDQYEAFASCGLKNNEDFREEWVQRGYQKVLEYIENACSEGNAMAAIENGGNVIAAIAESNCLQQYDWIMDFMPKARPHCTIAPGTGEVHFQANNSCEGIHNGVSIEVSAPELNVQYTPSRVDLSTKYYKKSFYDKGSNFDTYV